jgi:hypothetical protein
MMMKLVIFEWKVLIKVASRSSVHATNTLVRIDL